MWVSVTAAIRMPFVCGQLLVDRDVPAGVHDDRLAVGLAADQVAGLGEVVVIDALDKHLVLSFDERGLERLITTL